MSRVSFYLQLLKQTQTLISGFFGKKFISERQPFLGFLAVDAGKLSDADNNNFQFNVIGVLQNRGQS